VTHRLGRIGFALLMISAFGLAGRGRAEDGARPSDATGAAVGARQESNKPKTGAAPDSASGRSAQPYLNSLDDSGARFKQEIEKADAARQASVDAYRSNGPEAGTDSDASARARQRLAEQTWIAILACLGLALSLAAGVFVWRSRAQLSKDDGDILPVKREGAAEPATKDNTRRRAA
jgi:hypothetical protein